MRRAWIWLSWAATTVTLVTATTVASAADLVLLLKSRPANQLAMVRVDFSRAMDRGEIDASALPCVRAMDAESGTEMEVQYVPFADGTLAPGIGTLIVGLPRRDTREIRLSFDGHASPSAARQDITMKLPGVAIGHAVGQQAGMPSSMVFEKTKRAFTQFAWNDRLHHKESGGYMLRHDAAARVAVVSDGPLCTVVRTEAAYKRPDGTQPKSNPRAVYDWVYFRHEPVVFVKAVVLQDSPAAWNEVHFLELNFPGDDFVQWLGGEPASAGQLVGGSASHRLSDWAAVINGNDAIAMFGCGTVLIHDGRGAYGTYLHADGDRSWESWNGTRRDYSGWIRVGSDEDPGAAVRSLKPQLPAEITGVLTNSVLRAAIRAARDRAEQLPRTERAAELWRVAMAERLESDGKPDQATAALNDQLPDDWTVVRAGDLKLVLDRREDGIRPISLHDTRGNREHLADPASPLFRIALRNAETGEETSVDADGGWRATSVRTDERGAAELRWQSPDDASLGDLSVLASAVPDPECHALRWQLSVTAAKAPWSLWHVSFPQIELAAAGDEPALLFPRGPGEVTTNAWRQAFSFAGTYPSGWMSMQFFASYDRKTGAGLYWAIHDPMGSTKNLSARSQSPRAAVLLSAEHPVPNMGQPGTAYQLPGEAVWQLFSGDWYDAAQIYRQWVRQHARWVPDLGSGGREDTPAWMRELCVWAQAGGGADQCVEQVRRFAEYLGVPVGYHWYSWHEIPFDNDYPHYFPATDGFAEGVRRLHDVNVFVMPYINGRLWDTRDRGVEDFEFSRRGLPAATKDPRGEPYTETYGSKESDGSPVRLAVMCPSTATWQREVAGIINKLFEDCDVDGVYIDQIAAAAPTTCMDPAHGHPLGGGHWWNEGYWTMLDQLRRTMQPNQMLTSECNAEPFVRWLDGYLTWHWQYDGQVPAFPAIYGGAIQMFGRAYRGGDTRDLALRMKSAQQLVYGEQIGWLHPNVVDQPDNAVFLREVVRLRWQLRRYFSAGAMLRPPRLAGNIPRVRADWQWSNEWWVETDALLAGTWHLPHENTLVAIFTNVSDETLSATWSLDSAANGIPSPNVRLRTVTAEGPGEAERAPAVFSKPLNLPPRSVMAIEVSEAVD